MRIRQKIVLLLLPLAVLGSVAAADDAADRTAIEAAAQALTNAYNTRDIEAMLDVMSADVMILESTQAAISGRPAAREALERAVASAQPPIASTTQEIVIAGELAWRIATLRRVQSGVTSKSERSLEIWQRTGRQWKLKRLMSSGFLAPNAIVRPRLSEPRLDEPRH